MKSSYYLTLVLIACCTISRTQNNSETRLSLNEHDYSTPPASYGSLVSITAPDVATDLENITPLLGSDITANLGSVDIATLAEECSLSTDNVPPLLGPDTITPSMGTSLYPIAQPQVVENTPITSSAHERAQTIDESSAFFQLRDRVLTRLQAHSSAQRTSTCTSNAHIQPSITQTEPSSSSARSHVCKACGRKTANKGALIIHMRMHTGERPFRCTHDRCTKAFKTKGSLTLHMRTHTGAKPFKCTHPGCAKAFAHGGNLSRHMRIHTGNQPFKCTHPGCTKAFSRQDHRKRHMRREHTS